MHGRRDIRDRSNTPNFFDRPPLPPLPQKKDVFLCCLLLKPFACCSTSSFQGLSPFFLWPNRNVPLRNNCITVKGLGLITFVRGVAFVSTIHCRKSQGWCWPFYIQPCSEVRMFQGSCIMYYTQVGDKTSHKFKRPGEGNQSKEMVAHAIDHILIILGAVHK